MEIIKLLEKFDGEILSNIPDLELTNLFKKCASNFYFEFVINNEKYLFTPEYTQIRGKENETLSGLIAKNHDFLDSLKLFIINSIFLYSAIIEENSYYLLKPQSIIIGRLVPRKPMAYELKFYTHYDDELLRSYSDKFYIGRGFINLNIFEQKYLGLKDIFLSLKEQNIKIQKRAKERLGEYNDYKKPFLNEIEYLIKETVTEAVSRIRLIPEVKQSKVSRIKMNTVQDNILYVLNLMIELRDFTQEFETKLRANDEIDFVKYVTKFLKDLTADIRYLRKITFYTQAKISNTSML